jgi:hypothetical protein
MAFLISKVKSLTCVPVGSGGVTGLGTLTNGSFSQSQNEIEIPTGETYYPIILPGGRKEAFINVTSVDLDAYKDLVLKQFYTDVELTCVGVDCSTGESSDYKIKLTKAILSEIGEISAAATGDSVFEYTVTFKAIGDCSGNDNEIVITNE